MRLHALIFALCLTACAGGPQPKSLSDLAASHDWGKEAGKNLNTAFDKNVRRILKRSTRPQAIEAVREAGYECIYGEGHEDYPEPAAQCTRSFATRACQMDWEIFLTSDPKVLGEIDEAAGSFRRDCVGRDRDWPEAVDSPIDDQLAPAPGPNRF
ncbi:MAG: hypothetical protein SGJ21_06810 [Alphaproteobacteria bacterium]|nr:hypothetical protein [Alphaproteobacteria bacterium]